MDNKTRQEISNNIADIMIQDGPDGHCDGCGVITSYVEALLEGKGKEWMEKYKEKNNGKD